MKTLLCAFLLLAPLPLVCAADSSEPPPLTNVTFSNPNVALVSVVVAQENYKRRGIQFYNNSANSVYLVWGPTATSANCAVIIPTFATWTWPGSSVYAGKISAIRNAGTGPLNVYEFY